MNYLAHFHLAGTDENAWMGALLGDYIKGPLRGEFPATWEQGIRLHRRIDAISDAHPLRAEFAAALPQIYRRYAGIILDVCCDHWLSQHWSAWSELALPDFAQSVYIALERNAAYLPDRPQRFAARLREYDMLCGYRNWDSVPTTLQRIGTRLSRENPLEQANDDIRLAADTVAHRFPDFYEELQTQLKKDFSAAR